VPAAGSGANTGGNGANVAGGAAGAAGASAQAGTGALGAQAGNGGDVASIHYYGRWDRQPGKAIAVNGGSHVRAQFSGTGVSARFDISLNQAPNPTLVWRIDQGAWQEGELAASVVLATGLAAANHDLLLMIRGLNEYQNRWAPPLISAITFLGIDVTGGALTPSARAVGPRLEFLGDSITEGVAVWPNRTGKDTACWRADGRLGYAAQTSLTLGADWRQVGFGGEGVLKPGNGGVPVLNDSFNWIYAGVQRDAWQPDLAIINAGTVDRTDLGPNFGPAYTTYVSTVRAGYPGAKIVLLRPFGGYHAAEVKAEAAARNAAGDARIFYVDTTGWLSAPDYTDGIHPNVQGSAKVALALSAELKRIGLP
jgi:lysophospholipase L1-like esterase